MQGDNYYGGLVDRAKLRSFVDRESALQDEEAVIKEDRRELRRELRAAGFNLPAFNAIVRESKMTDEQRDSRNAFVAAYRSAMGFADSPLGREALERALQSKPVGRPPRQPREQQYEPDPFADIEPAGAA